MSKAMRRVRVRVLGPVRAWVLAGRDWKVRRDAGMVTSE